MKSDRAVLGKGRFCARGDAGTPAFTPQMTFARAFRSQALRLRRSPLVALHLACALAAGVGCGAYFAFAPWDAAFGADAYVQLLGAMMPLMAGIICGLDVDADNEATGLADLLSVPSRRIALLARIAVLWLMGAAALAVAVAAFAGMLALAGRDALGAASYAGAIVGLSLGSVLLYALNLAIALRFGRNASIAVGAVGLLIAFFSVGGLAHGLMTGELTAVASAGVFGYVPLCWAARLGSLAVELAIANGPLAAADAAGQVMTAIGSVALLCAMATVLIVGLLLVWIERFEPVGCQE